MGWISDLITNVSAFRIKIGEKLLILKAAINLKANIDGSNIPPQTQWANLHAGGLDGYVFHGSDVGSNFESVLVISQGAIFRTNTGGFRTWVGIGTMSDLTTTHKTDLVGAINEVNGYVYNLQQQYHYNFQFLETINQHLYIGAVVDFNRIGFKGGNLGKLLHINEGWQSDEILNYNWSSQYSDYIEIKVPSVVDSSALLRLQRNGTLYNNGQIVTKDHGTSADWITALNLIYNGGVFRVYNNVGGNSSMYHNGGGKAFGFTDYPVGNNYGPFFTFGNTGDYRVDFSTHHVKNAPLRIRVNGDGGVGIFRTIWDELTFNPDTKANAWDNATAIGFANGSFSGLPYFYHPTGGAKFVVSVEYLKAQDFASVTYVNQQIQNISLTPGPQGIQGVQGPPGPPGVGLPNPGVEVLNFSPGSHVVDNQLAMTIVRCTSSGTYTFDLQPGKYDGAEICITTCGFEYNIGGELLSMCGTSSFGSSTASRWIWADQLAKWVQVG